MSKLFSPLTIKNVTLKNRIVVSPMCQYSSVDGFANDWHLVHLGSRAVGGAGLIFTEATSVSPEGRISPDDLGIWKDEHTPGLERITDFIHQHGSIAGIQLAHAGRKASTASPWKGGKQITAVNGGWQTVAPSAIGFTSDIIPPAELDSAGIQKVLTNFKAAAQRALIAGFKVIEIHAAHGYLIHEFLSPLSNHRTDTYGGSFENRTRLLREVVTAIRSVWLAENPLFVRISSSEWTNGGWTIEDSVALASILKSLGVDLIDCSSGGNVAKVIIPLAPGYQVPFAEAVRKSGILTGAVGLITTAEQAEAIVAEGKADVVFFAREILRNPYFPLQAVQQLGDEIEWAVQYVRAKPFKN
ncbi:MAG: NADPH dehydrogenase NamA [Bacteroidota bacterium]|nr:NADPH dehydrogenase NamA [Bacteroidota bacterium]